MNHWWHRMCFMYTKTDAYNFNTETQVVAKYWKLTAPTKVKNIKILSVPRRISIAQIVAMGLVNNPFEYSPLLRSGLRSIMHLRGTLQATKRICVTFKPSYRSPMLLFIEQTCMRSSKWGTETFWRRIKASYLRCGPFYLHICIKKWTTQKSAPRLKYLRLLEIENHQLSFNRS